MKDIVLEKVFSKEFLDKSHELYSQVGSPKFNESVIQSSDELQEMLEGKELK